LRVARNPTGDGIALVGEATWDKRHVATVFRTDSLDESVGPLRLTVAQFSTSGVVLKQYEVNVRNANGIVTGPDGALWLSAFNKYGTVVRLTTNGRITYFKKDIWKAAGITPGPNGAIWITQWSNLKHPHWLEYISRLQ
jgi:hypothetical protein